MCSLDEEKDEKEKKQRKAKMKKRILLKMLKLYKDEDDVNQKSKINKTMKCLDEKKYETSNEMIHFTFDVHTTDLDSFDSSEATNSILEFADETNE